MKFYRDKNNNYYFDKIYDNNFIIIYCNDWGTKFYKNGCVHNFKNAAYIDRFGYKFFYLNDKLYGNKYHFIKESWRKFCKLQVFL